MNKDRKTPVDKLNTLFFRRMQAPEDSKPFPEIYPGDFCADPPLAKYLGTEKMPLPPGRVYDVREYGAVPNDRQRLATLGVNYAISLCAKNGGGTVLLSGGDYYCQTVELKSNVTLFIEKGSRLVASQTLGGYHHHALLYCDRGAHITVTGGGKICGEGNYFSLMPAAPPQAHAAAVLDAEEMERSYQAQMRQTASSCYGYLVYLHCCQDVQMHHIILENAADWTCRLHLCDRVAIHHTIVQNSRHIARTDGFVLTGSSHTEIRDCFISTGGDGITMKNALWLDCSGPMGHIHIHDCEIITPSTAVRIGSETTFDLHHIVVERCLFHMSDSYPGSRSGLSVESCDGALICDVSARELQMERVACPVFMRLTNRNLAADREFAQSLPEWAQPKDVLLPADRSRFDWKGGIRRVAVSDVTAKQAELPCIVAGAAELRKGVKYIEDVQLSGIRIQYRRCKEVYDRRLFVPEYLKEEPCSWGFHNLPAYGLWARHVKRISVNNFYCQPAKSTWKQCFLYEDAK